MATAPYQHIRIIVNPAAGQNEPILNTLNDVFHPYKLEWEVRITLGPGDATRLAQEAVAKGVDLVAGYGGDGTQMEIANGLLGSDIPMAILPGGTGNAIAIELNIPRNLKQAAELICQSRNQRKIDLGRIGKRHFMLRTYAGPQQEQATSRAMKDKMGLLAYPVATLRMLKELPRVRYQLTIDGREIEDEGMICYLFNAGSVGGVDVPVRARIDPSDGLLDVLLVNKNRQSLNAVVSYALDVGPAKARVHQWQGQEIRLRADPEQTVWIDGEPYGQTPFTALVVPEAIQVVVPERGVV